MFIEDRKTRLAEKILNSKEFREGFVEEHIYTGIPFQLHAMRNGETWTQAELGERAGMAQSRISKMENQSNGELNNLSTLIKIAHAFGVGLMVRFLPLSELLEWELHRSPESLHPLRYDKDPYFKEKKSSEELIAENSNNQNLRNLNIDYSFIPKRKEQMEMERIVNPQKTAPETIMMKKAQQFCRG